MYKCLLAFIFAIPCLLPLRSNPDQPFESLKGIDSVGIHIVGLDQTSAQYGLLEKEIADEAAAFLKKYGITPVSARNMEKIPGKPYLQMHFSIQIDPTMNVAAVKCSIALIQDVRLVRDQSIQVVEAATWDNSSIALMKPEYIKDLSQIKVDDFLKQFVEEVYLANAKPSPTRIDHNEKAMITSNYIVPYWRITYV